MNKLKTSCPNCGKTLFYGPLGLGPSAVECKRCGTQINTGLTAWSDLSLIRKIGSTLKELIAPSFLLGLDSFMIRFLLFVPTYWVVFSLPFVIPASILMDRMQKSGGMDAPSPLFTLTSALLIIGGCVYPVYVVLRLIRLIAHSYAFEKKGEYPKW